MVIDRLVESMQHLGLEKRTCMHLPVFLLCRVFHVRHSHVLRIGQPSPRTEFAKAFGIDSKGTGMMLDERSLAFCMTSCSCSPASWLGYLRAQLVAWLLSEAHERVLPCPRHCSDRRAAGGN